jgi:hypothetical protein
MTDELHPPPGVASDPRATEVLRVCTTGDSQTFVLRADVWSDPAAWGLLLVDLARHVAKAYAEAEGTDPHAVLARVKAGFDAEWNHPTDTPH